MARKSGPTISQEELYPLANEPGREEVHDARLLDLEVEQEPHSCVCRNVSPPAAVHFPRKLLPV
jgi:hypothetical protein